MYFSVFILIQRNLIAYNLSNFFSLCSFSTPTRYKTIWNIYLFSSFSNSFRLICTQNLLTHIMNVKAHTKTHTHIVSECFNINLLSHTLSTDLREKNERDEWESPHEKWMSWGFNFSFVILFVLFFFSEIK